MAGELKSIKLETEYSAVQDLPYLNKGTFVPTRLDEDSLSKADFGINGENFLLQESSSFYVENRVGAFQNSVWTLSKTGGEKISTFVLKQRVKGILITDKDSDGDKDIVILGHNAQITTLWNVNKDESADFVANAQKITRNQNEHPIAEILKASAALCAAGELSDCNDALKKIADLDGRTLTIKKEVTKQVKSKEETSVTQKKKSWVPDWAPSWTPYTQEEVTTKKSTPKTKTTIVEESVTEELKVNDLHSAAQLLAHGSGRKDEAVTLYLNYLFENQKRFSSLPSEKKREMIAAIIDIHTEDDKKNAVIARLLPKSGDYPELAETLGDQLIALKRYDLAANQIGLTLIQSTDASTKLAGYKIYIKAKKASGGVNGEINAHLDTLKDLALFDTDKKSFQFKGEQRIEVANIFLEHERKDLASQVLHDIFTNPNAGSETTSEVIKMRASALIVEHSLKKDEPKARPIRRAAPSTAAKKEVKTNWLD